MNAKLHIKSHFSPLHIIIKSLQKLIKLSSYIPSQVSEVSEASTTVLVELFTHKIDILEIGSMSYFPQKKISTEFLSTPVRRSNDRDFPRMGQNRD